MRAGQRRAWGLGWDRQESGGSFGVRVRPTPKIRDRSLRVSGGAEESIPGLRLRTEVGGLGLRAGMGSARLWLGGSGCTVVAHGGSPLQRIGSW